MRRSPALFAVLLLAAGASSREVASQESARTASPEEARALVANCAASADRSHGGLGALEQDCPGLDVALTQLRLKEPLVEGAAGKVNADSLAALLTAMRPATRASPDTARLKPIVDGLRVAPAQDSLWQRIKHGFERLYMSRRDRGSWAWLEEWLERLTPGKLVRDMLVWGLIVMLVAAAAVVVVREVRASGVRWTGLLARRARAFSAADAAAADAPEPDDWQRLGLTQRPAALFRQVAARLVAEGRLPPLGSHTHRELRHRAHLEAPEEREAWGALARAAERQIYAPCGVAKAEAEAAVTVAARLWAGPR